MHLIYVNRTRVNMLRLNIFLYIVAFWQHLLVILLAWLMLCRHQCSCYASVNSSCAQPPPPLGYCGAFARLVSPGGGAFANFALPGDRAFANPGAISELLTRSQFPIRIWLHRRFYWKKKQTGSPVKDRNELKRVVKACSWFYAYISSLLIKPELHSENRKTIDVNQRVLLLNQISVDIIWRTFFHIYITIHNI